MPTAAAGATAVPAATASGGLASVLPWGVAFVALMAVVAMLAGQNFGAERGSVIDGSANALPTPSIDGPAFGGGAPGGAAPGGGARPPDISNMSPEERAVSLYNRIISADERGLKDSVLFFAPMGLAAHELLRGISIDNRYHAGRIAEVAGLPVIARAQSDTILSIDQNHLLGIILGIRAARLAKNEPRARELEAQLLRVADAEQARQLPEYEGHPAEIRLALTIASGGAAAR